MALSRDMAYECVFPYWQLRAEESMFVRFVAGSPLELSVNRKKDSQQSGFWPGPDARICSQVVLHFVLRTSVHTVAETLNKSVAS